MSEPVFIGLNKRKLKIQVLIYSLLALLSFLFCFGAAENQDFIPPIIFQASGVVLLLLFVLVAGAKGKKISDPESGLLIDKQGVHDKTSDIALGLIKWKDIVEVKAEESLKTGLLLIMVKKNEDYVKKAKNNAIGSLLRQNVRLYDTPVAIDPSYLKADLADMLKAITDFKK